jgi:hypothetical protein
MGTALHKVGEGVWSRIGPCREGSANSAFPFP